MDEYGLVLGPALNVMNLRFSKDFRIGGSRRVGLDFDIFNLLSSNAPNQLVLASGPTYPGRDRRQRGNPAAADRAHRWPVQFLISTHGRLARTKGKG